MQRPSRKQTTPHQRLSLLAVLFLASACGGGDELESQFRVASYNAGLAPGFLDYVPERSDVTPAAAAELAVDALCIQEVWLDADVASLQSATATQFPEFTTIPAAPELSEEAPCALMELDPLVACMNANCSGMPRDQWISCGLDSCTAEVATLSNPCLNCLQTKSTDTNITTFEAFADACEVPASLYTYDGSFGLALLTSATVEASDTITLDANTIRRGALYQRITKEDVGTFHVFCTHLSADLSFENIPYPDANGSWAQENADQVAALLAWIDSIATDGNPIVLLGDFNISKANGAIDAELAENYAAFTAAGYSSVFADSEAAACTFCAANSLTPGNRSSLLDHIWLKGFNGEVISTERVLDEPVTLDVDGQPVETFYSDHFGIQATFGP